MHRSKKIKIGDVNPHLLCVLCGGYFVDATTIIECLHSFCKTCIIRYLESNKTCPSCDVLIHKTRPRLNIRSDKTLQDIVYKLVPGLYKNEMRRRREFYSQYPNKDDTHSPSEKRGDEMAERFIFTENEKISLALEYWRVGIPDGAGVKSVDKKTKVEKEEKHKTTDIRYLQCPGALTVAHLKKFIRLKFELPARCRIDIYHKKEMVSDLHTLLDIACIFSWKRLEPLRLYYSIYENIVKKRKIEETVTSKLMASAETQTKEEANEGCSEPQKTKLSTVSGEHKFLTPTATKDWNPSPNRTSPISTTKHHSKVILSASILGQPLPATPKVSEQQNQKPPSPRPLIQTTLTAKKPAHNVIKAKTLSKTTVVKPPKQNQKSTLKRLSYQPAKIAPKIQTNPSPNRLLNQHSEIKNQLTVQSSTVKPSEKHGSVQTVRLLVNNKTVLNQVTSAAPVKVTQRPILQQNVCQNTDKLTNSVTTVTTNPTTSIGQHVPVSVSVIPQQIADTKAKTTLSNQTCNESVKPVQHIAAKQIAASSTACSVVSTPSIQSTAKSTETVLKPVSIASKQPKCVTPKTVTANIGNGNGNGPLKVNMMDLSSVPEGAVIRSVRPNDSMMLSHLGSKSANSLTVKSSTPYVEKQSNNQSKNGTTIASFNGRAMHPMPNVTGMPVSNMSKANGRPTTPKPNSVSRPPTPQLNNITRPVTPKVSNDSRPNTPKLNGVSKPNTHKVNGSSRSATPVSVGSESYHLKPIAPKPILPKEDIRVSPPSVNPDLRLSMAYSKVQIEKRPIPTIDSSSSDICEEIRQRKLARMDEPLNLVKRDQDKKKSLSPVNGNVSPNVSPINNPLPMVVGSMGGI